MFEKITAAPADPILGLADSFRADPRENKINLGIGVYKDESGKTPVLDTVKKQRNSCLKTKIPKTILPSVGCQNLVVSPKSCYLVKSMKLSPLNALVLHKRLEVRVPYVLPLTLSLVKPMLNVFG